MLNIAVLVSGGGTNLQALLDSEARGENPNGRITLVVASKPGVYALERAAKAGVESCVVRRKDYASSEDFDAALLKTLKDHNIDLVVLAGFLSVLGPSVIEAYPRRILNVHPALIPSFCGPGMYGLRPHEAALAGDVILALPSTGVHSNGFSLVRKIFDIDANPDVLHTAPAELGGKTLGEALLAPTKIYVKPVLKVLEEVDVKGISHITGGGFYENIPRSLKKGCCARINKADVRTPALFQLMQKTGNISEHDMFNTFNMGVGMVLTVPAEQADKALDILHANGEPEAYRLGVIAEGEGVELC